MTLINSCATCDCDVVIVGAGPAAFAAAINLASEGARVIIVDEKGPGGQVATSSKIENVFGIPSPGLTGAELMDRAIDQAIKVFGVKLRSPFRVVRHTHDETSGVHTLISVNRERITARAVLLALGASPRRLDAKGIEQFMNRGVSYGSPQYHQPDEWVGKKVAIIGGGNSSGQAARFLSACHECHVRMFVRGEGLEDDMSRYLLSHVQEASNIEVFPHSTLKGVDGDDQWMKTIAIETRDGDKVTTTDIPVDYLFIQIGNEPPTGWLDVELDSHGYIYTDRDLPSGVWPEVVVGRPALPYETSKPGVFAAGDVRAFVPKRMSVAIGEGAAAAVSIYRHLTVVNGKAKH